MDAFAAAGSNHSEPSVHFASVRFDPLRAFVRMYWEVHGSFPHVRERVLPTTDIFVLVNLGAPHALITESKQVVYTEAWVAGIQTAALITAALGRTDVWGARLTASGAQLAFGSTAVLADSVISLADLGDDLAGLSGRLREASSFQIRCELFESFLCNAREVRRNRWRPEVAWALDRLADETPLRIADIASEIGWSRKHLHGQFLDHTGVSPKTFARIARFERAMQLMSVEASSLAAVSVAAGYYDQAHFTREFGDFAGITPTHYLRSRVAGTDYGFVDDDG